MEGIHLALAITLGSCGAGGGQALSDLTDPEPDHGRRAQCRASHGEILDALRDVHVRQSNVGVQAAVMFRGEIVFSEALGMADIEHGVPVTEETRFGIASVTKAFTGLALLQAVDEGAIDLAAPIQHHLPAFRPKDGGDITARLLAGHLAGIRHYRDERTPEFYATHFADVADALRLFEGDPLVSSPGTEYHYSSYGYNLLAALVQSATGTRFQERVEDRILEPLGLRDTSFDDIRFPLHARSERYSYYDPWTLADSDRPFLVPRWNYSYNAGGGNLVSTARDLVRFGQAVAAGEGLERASRQRLSSPISTERVESSWTYGWFARTDARGRRFLRITGSNAGVQAALVVYPDEELSVAVLSNTWGIGSQSAEMVVDLPARMATPCLVF